MGAGGVEQQRGCVGSSLCYQSKRWGCCAVSVGHQLLMLLLCRRSSNAVGIAALSHEKSLREPKSSLQLSQRLRALC